MRAEPLNAYHISHAPMYDQPILARLFPFYSTHYSRTSTPNTSSSDRCQVWCWFILTRIPNLLRRGKYSRRRFPQFALFRPPIKAINVLGVQSLSIQTSSSSRLVGSNVKNL